MPIGFEATNNGGTIQVNDEYRNMLLIASGQFTVNNQTSQQDLWYQYLINNVQIMTPSAMLVLRAPSVGLNASIGSYRGSRKIVNYGYIRGTTVTFQFYIFDLVGPAYNGLGLQTFDVRGNLVYDAMDYPLKIITTLTIPNNGADHRVVYVAPHSNVGYACLGGGNFFDDDGFDGESYKCFTYFNGTNLVSWNSYDDQAAGGGQGIGNWGVMEQYGVIVDVSNFPLNYRRP